MLTAENVNEDSVRRHASFVSRLGHEAHTLAEYRMVWSFGEWAGVRPSDVPSAQSGRDGGRVYCWEVTPPGRMAERSNAAVLKTAGVHASVASNPISSASNSACRRRTVASGIAHRANTGSGATSLQNIEKIAPKQLCKCVPGIRSDPQQRYRASASDDDARNR